MTIVCTNLTETLILYIDHHSAAQSGAGGEGEGQVVIDRSSSSPRITGSSSRALTSSAAAAAMPGTANIAPKRQTLPGP